MDLNDLLLKLGLLENEVAVYFACLEIGEANIIPIKEKSNLPRTTVFHCLERLSEKGLIEIMETPTRRVYIAYPPRKILTLIKNKQEELKEQSDNLQKFLPEFNRLYLSSAVQPKVRFFRGEEIKEIYEEILASPIDKFRYLGETNKLTEILDHNFFKKWIDRKVEKGIWSYALRVKGNDDAFFNPKEGLRRVRFLPESFKSPVHFYIYGDNVAVLTSAQENFGVVTTSRDYAKAMKSWYQALWDISTPA